MNLEQHIIREIENKGPISFARFMELALYAPELGYYEHAGKVGRTGDFYTSVSVGSVFGELLAAQFALWMSQIDGSASGQLVECGANDGQLAHDILGSLRPDLAQRIHYVIIEPSPMRRAWQKEKLHQFANVRWCLSWDDLDPVNGIIFSNELLDAIPFRRLRWDQPSKSWQELVVSYEPDHGLRWATAPVPPLIEIPTVSQELAAVLPDGFTTEVFTAAADWWKTAANKLNRGKLMTFDYGLLEEDFLMTERSRGTARGYYQHRMVDDLLGNVGAQDITAHVNFSSIIRAGDSAGLSTEFFGSQAKFITGILGQITAEAERWDRKKIAQLQTLTHPAHLGTKFKVLVQGR